MIFIYILYKNQSFSYYMDMWEVIVIKDKDYVLMDKKSVFIDKRAKIGKNVRIAPTCFILCPQNLTIGDNVIVNDNNTFMCWNRITIEKNSFTSVNVTFVAGTHNVKDYSDISENQDIIIGPGTWIGAACSIQGGAHVNRGSIIGTGAVVLGKEYDEFSILAGVPAKILKKRDAAEIILQPVIYNKKELFENV